MQIVEHLTSFSTFSYKFRTPPTLTKKGEHKSDMQPLWSLSLSLTLFLHIDDLAITFIVISSCRWLSVVFLQINLFQLLQLTFNYDSIVCDSCSAILELVSIRRVTVNMGMSMPSWFDINSLEPELFKLNPPGLKDQISARKFHGRKPHRMSWDFRARSFLFSFC